MVRGGAWLRRALVCLGGQGEALPLPASGARERRLGQHAVLTLPEAMRTDVGRRTDATQSRPYPRQSEKGNRGPGYWQAARAISGLSIRQTLTAIRLGQHAVLTLPDKTIIRLCAG